jgi:hypothetical protein
LQFFVFSEPFLKGIKAASNFTGDHVQKLGEFIDAEASEPFGRRKNSRIAFRA